MLVDDTGAEAAVALDAIAELLYDEATSPSRWASFALLDSPAGRATFKVTSRDSVQRGRVAQGVGGLFLTHAAVTVGRAACKAIDSVSR